VGTNGDWLESTPFRGVRYRKHPTRKHRLRPDRYFAIRYQKDGRRREVGLGWASEKWTPDKAALTLAELRSAAHVVAVHEPLSSPAKKEAAKRHRKN
jgi:hypothetical protein